MAFGFGPGSDMMKSVKSNRKQLRSKQSLKDVQERFKDVGDKEKTLFKKVPESEVIAFKKKFAEKQKKEKQQHLILMAGIAIMVLVLFYFVLFYV